MEDQSRMDNGKWLYKRLTEKIIGCCYRVHNELGSGHKESVYQGALSNEFDDLGIKHGREVQLQVKYKNNSVGTYRADFVVENKVIVETKAVEFIPIHYEVQLVHYLKTTGYKLGLLVNFGTSKVQIRRRIWTPS